MMAFFYLPVDSVVCSYTLAIMFGEKGFNKDDIAVAVVI